MQIKSLTIKNFKSIKEIRIDDIENALILVGKNNTGKTIILDAIRAVGGDYVVKESDFNESKQNIEIGVTLEITEEDLEQFHTQCMVSNYKRFESWKRSFYEKLPSYQNGLLEFVCVIHQSGKKRYDDGFNKNNRYISEVFPKLYFIDTARNVESFQEDMLVFQNADALVRMHSKSCMFDSSKECQHCFQCIGLINQKKPEELQLHETARLLEYKMYQLNLSDFSDKVNANYHKNGGVEEIRYTMSFDMEKVFDIKAEAWHEEAKHLSEVNHLGNGMRSIYMLSLLETYIEDEKLLPSIIIVEYPELFLHPSLQKTASKILYQLSKKNQVIFTTHSPNMVANFTSGQLCQIYLDREGYSSVRRDTDLDDVLNDLGYSANDFLNVDFVFIVEGKQDQSRLPLLLEKYYSEVQNEKGELSRISILTTNSCTNIKTYANLKYMNQLYLRDQFLMIRDGDGKNREELAEQLCEYYRKSYKHDDKLPRVTRDNVLVLKYYSFENYFLNPKIMAELGIVKTEEAFWQILFSKWKKYLYKLASGRRLVQVLGKRIETIKDLKENFEEFKIYMRGHNLYDIFYGRYRGREREILKQYIEIAPREDFKDILDAIDRFVYFENRKTGAE